jgi:predicted small secreted protein
MKSTLGSMIGFALCALLMTACGDVNDVRGFGGGTICASDDSGAGDMYECPGGEKTFDFCINTGNGSCYYVVDGAQLNCGNCFEGDTINACAAQAAEACN